jgi:protease-4
MTAEQLKALVDKGLLLDTEARDAGLIDVLDYGDRLTEKIKTDITGKPDSDEVKFVPMDRYARARVPETAEAAKLLGAKKSQVALIYAVGQIVTDDPRRSGGMIAASTMGTVFNDAIEDKNIKVIVLRIDSPGGSPVASETLRWKIRRAQEKGKKVVVSMGATAASGGYWMVAPADYIFATPLTLTGSIGVAGGKFVLRDLWAKIGVHWDDVSWGANSGMSSVNEPYSDSERARYAAMMDNVYNEFVTRVADGRKMDFNAAEALAHGRVWTGLRAQQNGLVDRIGGLDNALDYAAQLVGAKDRSELNITVLPKPQSAFERIAKLLEMQAGIHNWIQTVMHDWNSVRYADDFMVYQDVTVR